MSSGRWLWICSTLVTISVFAFGAPKILLLSLLLIGLLHLLERFL